MRASPRHRRSSSRRSLRGPSCCPPPPPSLSSSAGPATPEGRCAAFFPIRRRFFEQSRCLHRLADLAIHRFRRTVAGIYLKHAVTRYPEVLQHRPRLPVIRVQTPANHGLAIIIPDDEFLPIPIAHSLHPRRVRGYIVQSAATRTQAASGQTSDNNIVIYCEVDHHLVNSPARQPLRHPPGPHE